MTIELNNFLKCQIITKKQVVDFDNNKEQRGAMREQRRPEVAENGSKLQFSTKKINRHRFN